MLQNKIDKSFLYILVRENLVLLEPHMQNCNASRISLSTTFLSLENGEIRLAIFWLIKWHAAKLFAVFMVKAQRES